MSERWRPVPTVLAWPMTWKGVLILISLAEIVAQLTRDESQELTVDSFSCSDHNILRWGYKADFEELSRLTNPHAKAMVKLACF